MFGIAIQTLLTSGVGVGRRFGEPRAFAGLNMGVGYDTRSMLREEPLGLAIGILVGIRYCLNRSLSYVDVLHEHP